MTRAISATHSRVVLVDNRVDDAQRPHFRVVRQGDGLVDWARSGRSQKDRRTDEQVLPRVAFDEGGLEAVAHIAAVPDGGAGDVFLVVAQVEGLLGRERADRAAVRLDIRDRIAVLV